MLHETHTKIHMLYCNIINYIGLVLNILIIGIFKANALKYLPLFHIQTKMNQNKNLER